MRRRVVGTYDDVNAAWRVLDRERGKSPRGAFDLVSVRHAHPPIRTPNRWAVVEYVEPGPDSEARDA